MKTVAILTDFVSHDPAYSLCGVVDNQIKMFAANGYVPRLLVRKGFSRNGAYRDADIREYDAGEIANNVVNVTAKSEGEIDSLVDQFRERLSGVDVVLTHDLLYQANMWKQHVAARRLAKETGTRWLHWVHSSTDLGTVGQTGRFREELTGKFPNARLVAMHREEMPRKGGLFGYEIDEIVQVPNPINLTENYHATAKHIVQTGHLSEADVIAVYPARLDRGKQPEIILEIFRELVGRGWDARVVIVDFHSTGGDKADYRKELIKFALETPVVPLQFSSIECAGLDNEYAYHLPHQAVMDLMEYSDIFVHPSRSESDPLTVPEAAWKRCGLVLNFDLPVFRQWEGRAILKKFSSNIDVSSGMPGETNTKYGDRRAYMDETAGAIAYLMQNNMILANHAKIRKERSLEAVWSKHLWPAIEGEP